MFHSNRTNATVHVNLVLLCLCSAIYDVCLSLPLPIRSNCVFLQRALFTSLRQNLSTSIIASTHCTETNNTCILDLSAIVSKRRQFSQNLWGHEKRLSLCTLRLHERPIGIHIGLQTAAEANTGRLGRYNVLWNLRRIVLLWPRGLHDKCMSARYRTTLPLRAARYEDNTAAWEMVSTGCSGLHSDSR